MTEIKFSSNETGLAPAFRASMEDVSFTEEGQFPALTFFSRCASSLGLASRRYESWSSEATLMGANLGRILLRETYDQMSIVVVELAATLACVKVTHGRAEAWLAAGPEAELVSALSRLKDALPPTRPHERCEVAVDFAWSAKHGTRWMTRTLGVPPWREIARNYPVATREALQRLAGGFKPGRSGQTIIWHGHPGTGKTSALRALAWEWREWCEVAVVLDPDRLFGHEAGYLLDVIGGRQAKRHRLIVLEDAGELLRRDARREVGQGLSRFLNACDGLLGQGQKLTMLVTTNEPIKSLHPAVSRAGRCAAEIEFVPFDRRAANRWLARRGPARVDGSRTLADLYALADGRVTEGHTPEATMIGFGSALESGRGAA